MVGDLTRRQARLVFGVELRGEDTAVGANREGAVFGVAQERRRPAESAILHGVREHVEVALVVHRELPRDPPCLLEREDLSQVLVGRPGERLALGPAAT